MELGPGVSRIVRDLLSSGSATEFLKSVVHSQLSYLNAVATALYTIDDEGFLTLQYQYGFAGPDFSPGSRRTIWAKSANTKALLSDKTLIYQSANEYSKDFPELTGLYDFSQLAIIPIWARGLPVGSLSLAFNFDFGPIPDAGNDLWEVYKLLGMVLLSPPGWLYALSQDIGIAPGDAVDIPQIFELSTAKTETLGLIGAGLTNKQIAAALSYSPSYVGKVNMTLFK